MLVSWRGHVFLEAGWLLYDGPVAPTTPHAHHAFQVVLASDSPLRIVAGNEELEVTTCVIPPDASHAFASATPRAVLLYVAPESREGRQLAKRLAGDVATPSAWIHAATGLTEGIATPIVSWVEARRVRDVVIARLVPEEMRARPWPPAIQRLVTTLPSRLDAPLRFAALARELEVSESRLAHLVTEHVGVPFRPYVLWLRLQRAAAELAHGRTLTEAAHHAGFADGAHLSRVFRRMFGIAPSELAAFAQWHLPD